MSFNWYSLLAAAMAAIVPVALMITRTELRRVRRLAIEELRLHLFDGLDSRDELPQITLVEARYGGPEGQQFAGSSGSRQAQLRIGAGATVFFIVCFGGFLLLLTPSQWLLSTAPDFPRVTYALLWTSQSSLPELLQGASVVGAAFLGGYVFQLRNLIRVTLNQELSALAFVRASVHIIQGALIAIIAYRVVGASTPTAATIALGVAFLIGYWPDLGLARIAKVLQVRLKAIDSDALADAKIIPLEIIDGIDTETAFRLQENNLHDVQNLATANPIQLYAETPFELLKIFDWVLQAQLCENVGPKSFSLLRQIGIRTIFDLERAALACGAPPDYVVSLGAILFKHADEGFSRRFGRPNNSLAALTPEHVRHAVAVILDDLHIHQLRALWRLMIEKTKCRDNPWLYPTGPLPGEPDLPPCR
jgi:hypothetical protein